jgi:hypothetical protein
VLATATRTETNQIEDRDAGCTAGARQWLCVCCLSCVGHKDFCCRKPQTTMRRLISISLALLAVAQVAVGLPLFIVTSGKPKCVVVEAPKETVLQVFYEAPGRNNL